MKGRVSAAIVSVTMSAVGPLQPVRIYSADVG